MMLLMVLHTIPVYAQEPQMSFSTIEYTVEDSFMVYISETMAIDEQVCITASQINIDPAKSVKVYISNFDTDDGIYITNVHNPDSTLAVHFRDAEGNTLSRTNQLVGAFTLENQSTLYLTPYVDYYAQEQTAGKYTGTVYFNIMCE